MSPLSYLTDPLSQDSHKGLSRFGGGGRLHLLIEGTGGQDSERSYGIGNIVVAMFGEYKIGNHPFITPGMLSFRTWPLLSLCLESSSLKYARGSLP